MSAAEAVTDALRELHTRFAGLRDGQLADYIPQLALADPDAFGLALISMDGHRYSTGDADASFTMQSVSKPFGGAPRSGPCRSGSASI
ncbi:glutaminase [Streptomyces sp. NPDC059153]|uniref:glutaminase n=1 Tax=unclassified Streptomyces TaxID=2593676 RepID=UPI0036B69754